MRQKCKECGHEMVELLTSVVCDWCEGIEEEWDDGRDRTTEPLFKLPQPPSAPSLDDIDFDFPFDVDD